MDSGIDQAPLSVQVLDANSNVLPVTDAHYARIYYRQKASNALVTGLLPPAGTADFVGVTPYAGAAYANNGTADSGAPGVFGGYHYVATTSTQDQKIIGYVSYGDTSPVFTQDIEIKATAINPAPAGSTVAGGLSLTGCSDFTGGGCRLAAPATSVSGAVTPVMYTATSSGPADGRAADRPAGDDRRVHAAAAARPHCRSPPAGHLIAERLRRHRRPRQRRRCSRPVTRSTPPWRPTVSSCPCSALTAK